METLKKVLAVIGLAAMAVFVVSVVVLLISGQLVYQSVWVYGSLSVFLIAGLGAVVIRYLQERAKERAGKDESNA